MKIDTAPSISSFHWPIGFCCSRIFKVQTKLILFVVNLDLKSWIIRKIILSNKIHWLRIKKCPETESKSKNPIKFADIYRSDACINVRSINFQLACVVSGSCFELMLINERTHNNRQINYFSKNVYSKAHKLIFKSNSRNTNLARGSVHASKISWSHGKNYSTQISNQGAGADLKMYKTSKINYPQIHNVLDYRVQKGPENSSKPSLLGGVSKQAKRSDQPWWKFRVFKLLEG